MKGSPVSRLTTRRGLVATGMLLLAVCLAAGFARPPATPAAESPEPAARASTPAFNAAMETPQASQTDAALLTNAAPAPAAPAAAQAPDRPSGIAAQSVSSVQPASRPAAGAGAPGRAGGQRVPVLMYHYIRVNPNPNDRLGFSLSVTPNAFAQQMAWLEDRGYHTVTLHQLAAAWRGEAELPDKPIVITLDDGYLDAYTAAFPELRTHGFAATAFIISTFVGRGGYMATEHLQELQAAGWEIASHTRTHPDVSRLSGARLAQEMEGAANELTEMTGQAPTTFAYPSGRFGNEAMAALRRLGYEAAVTTRYGLANPDADPLLLSRLRVAGGISLGSFAALIANAR